MIKLKNLLNEEKKPINEYRVQKAKDIQADPRIWKTLKYELQKQFYELEKIGPDYGVFVNAQGTEKILKQIKNLIHKI